MKPKKTDVRGMVAIVTILTLIYVSGCAPKTRIRASDAMFDENRVERIAVFTEGKINWPRMGRGGAVLGVADSKKAVEEHLAMTKQILSNKGYEVVFAESVGIGYHCNQWWLMPEEYGKDETCQLTPIPDAKPQFIFPKFQENEDFSRATHNLIRQVEAAIVQKRLYSFVPDHDDIEVIRQFTEADTICLNRIYGVKYSTGRKVGAFAMGVVAAMFGAYGQGHLSDMVDSFYIFIDARTGDVLWERGIYVAGDPVEPNQEFVAGVLKFFPAKNEPFNQEVCAKGEGDFVYCK